MSIADFIDPKWREELTRQLNERRAIVSRGVSCDQEGFSFSRHASKLCEHLQVGEYLSYNSHVV
jgi:hypothetical protein